MRISDWSSDVCSSDLAIGRRVAAEIPDDSSLFINIGTTTEAVARALLEHSGLRVITDNLNVAQILTGNPTFEVIIAGGVVRNRDGGIVGESATDLIQQFRVDIGVIGLSGIDRTRTRLNSSH